MASGLKTFDLRSRLRFSVFECILGRSWSVVLVVHVLSHMRLNVRLCLCLRAWTCNRFEDNDSFYPLPSPPPDPLFFSLKIHFSFGLMVECMSNFCPAQDRGFQKGNGIHPQKKLNSICQHQSNLKQIHQQSNSLTFISTNKHFWVCIQMQIYLLQESKQTHTHTQLE